MLNKKIKLFLMLLFLIVILPFTPIQADNSDFEYANSEECSATEPCESKVIAATVDTVTVEVMASATQIRQFVLRCDEFVMMRNSQVGDIVFVTLDFDGNVIVAKLTQ